MGAAPCWRRGRRIVVGPSALKLSSCTEYAERRRRVPRLAAVPEPGPVRCRWCQRCSTCSDTERARTTNDADGGELNRPEPESRRQVSTTHGPATDLPSPTPQSDVGERRVPSRETRSTEDQDEHEGRDGTARVTTAGLARISVLAPRSMSIVEQLGRSAACQRRRSCDLTVLSSLRSVPDA